MSQEQNKDVTKTITVTRALVLLKSLKNDLDTLRSQFSGAANSNSRSLLFIAIGIGTGDKAKPYLSRDPNATIDSLSATMTENFQKVQQMQQSYCTLKSRVVKSNAETQVVVNGVSMSIADAIVMKSTIGVKKAFLETLMLEQTLAARYMETAAKERDSELAKIRRQSADDAAGSEEMLAAIEKIYANAVNNRKAELEPFVIDPNKVNEVIANLKAEVQFLETELDSVITVSNSTTLIAAL